MSMSLVSMSILIYIQNIMQDYLEIRDGEVRDSEIEQKSLLRSNKNKKNCEIQKLIEKYFRIILYLQNLKTEVLYFCKDTLS